MRFSHFLVAALASVALNLRVSAFVADRSSDPVVHPLPFTPFIPTHYETYPSDLMLHTAGHHHHTAATHTRLARTLLENIATQRHGSAEQTGRDYVITHQHDDKNMDQTHVYATQVHPVDGLLIANAHMHVSSSASTGEVIAYSYNFVEFNAATTTNNKMWSDYVDTDLLTPSQAVDVLAAFTGYKFTMEQVLIIENQYIQTATNTIVPVYRINVRLQPHVDHWYDAHVSIQAADATDDNMGIISLVDWVNNAAYNVVPLGGYDPQHSGFSLITNPQDLSASSLGWHNDQSKTYTTTQGNNVLSKYMPKSGSATFANGGSTLVFNFPFNSSAPPAGNRDTAITNLFYWNNILHDISYVYGFTEAAGNFQQYNFGKGGKQLDPVIASADDPSGTNNANFATPPDGQSGTMRMYIFTETTPNRDGDFANDVISHEFMHGISNRLVGGASNVNCLSSGEPGGMGEGWGDFLALVLTRFNAKQTFNTSYGVGGWLINGQTIRKYLYSTDLVTNPTTYGYLQQSAWKEVHAIGEIWCNILYEVYWALATKINHYNSNLYSVDITSANTLVLAIVMDSFKLMPCSPTFVSARDSMIAAEKALTGGKYKCDLWYAFAKRGLGQGAVSGNGGKTYTQSFQLPTGC